jgi:hypothetical protein
MKIIKLFIVNVFFLSLFVSFSYAQWECKYVTEDASLNGTGYNTAAVAVFGEDIFVALVSPMKTNIPDTLTSCYLVGYRGAENQKGRLGKMPYTLKGYYMKWGTGADTVRMWNAWKIAAYPSKNLVFVANNDKDHSILTFELKQDTVLPAPYRMKTGSRNIWGIDVDDNGKVYVICDSTTDAKQADVMIFESVEKEAKWATTHDASPINTIDLPASLYKGIAVEGTGKFVYVADYKNKKVIKYNGSPTTSYYGLTNYFKLTAADSIPLTSPKIYACPIGLSYMRPYNILLVACDTFFRSNSGFSKAYSYGRIYLVDPMNGKLAGDVVGDAAVSVIDQAKWAYDKTGSYSSQDVTVSGYTSTYDVSYDQLGNVYSQSFYSWTVEKWSYFPVIPTLTKVKELSGVAKTYELKQNYPNPFNPSTNIEFSVPKESYVTLKVYNVLGQEVASLVNEIKQAGNYAVSFNASKLTSGTYFYSLQTGDYTAKKKMMLIK